MHKWRAVVAGSILTWELNGILKWFGIDLDFVTVHCLVIALSVVLLGLCSVPEREDLTDNKKRE